MLPQTLPPNLAPATARGFSNKTCPGQARSGLRPGAAGCVTGCCPTPLVTSLAAASPGMKFPPQALRAAVDLPNPRPAGLLGTAVSEWFEERGVTASFNSGGMTTAGRPARTRRSRVRRSCREGASASRPSASPNPLLGPPPDRPPVHPSHPPAPRVGFLWGSWGAGTGPSAHAQKAARRSLQVPAPPSHVPRSVRRGMCGRM